MSFFKFESKLEASNAGASDKRSELVYTSPLTQTSYQIGEKVIDKDGNNALVSEMFVYDNLESIANGKLNLNRRPDNIKLKYETGFTKLVARDSIKKGETTDRDTKHILETVYSIDTSNMSVKQMNSLYTVMHLYPKLYEKIPLPCMWKCETRDEEAYELEKRRNKMCFSLDLTNLSIDLSSEEIQSIYDKYGVIQLRRINSKILIVGCGNEPFILAKKSDPGYSKEHAHTNALTINPELEFNATIIGRFTEDAFRFEPNFFEEVCFEMYIGRIIEDLNETKRILQDGGKITFKTDGLPEISYKKEQIDLLIEHYKINHSFDCFKKRLDTSSLEIKRAEL